MELKFRDRKKPACNEQFGKISALTPQKRQCEFGGSELIINQKMYFAYIQELGVSSGQRGENEKIKKLNYTL